MTSPCPPKRFWIDWPLRAKLTLAFLLVSLAPLGLLGYVNYRALSGSLEATASRALTRAADNTAGMLDGFLRSGQNLVRRGSRLEAISGWLDRPSPGRRLQAQDMLEALGGLARARALVQSIALLDHRGFNLLDTDPSHVGGDESGKGYFFRARSQRGGYISSVLQDRGHGSGRLVFSQAVYSRDLRFLGVLRLEYSARVIRLIIDSAQGLGGAGSFAWLLDGDMLFLSPARGIPGHYHCITALPAAKPNSLQVQKCLPHNYPNAQCLRNPALARAIRDYSTASNAFTLPLLPNGQGRFTGLVARLSAQPWQVVFLQPRDAFMQPIQTQTRVMAYLAAAMGLAVLIAAFLVSRLLIRPVIHLAQVADKLAAGDLEQTIEVCQGGEIGRLAAAFARLRDAISEKISSLNREIQTRERAERALRAQGEHLSAIWDSTQDAIITMDRQRQITSCNQAFLSMFGFDSQRQVRGQSVRIIHPSNKSFKDFGRQFFEVIKEKGNWRGEWTLQRLDGSPQETESMISVLHGPDGGQAGYVSVLRDITERKRAEEALRESQHRMTEMLANVQMVAVMLDPTGRVTFANEYLLNLAGWSREEVVGADWFGLSLPEQDTQKVKQGFLGSLAQGNIPAQFENSITAKNGSQHLVVWSNSIMRSVDGQVIGTASLGVDVTEHRLLEEQLRQARKMEAVGTLAGGIAHDFNNILGAIIGYCELALDQVRQGQPNQRELNQILSAGLRASNLVRQLLTFSRKLEANLGPVRLNRLVRDSVRMLERIIPKMVSIETDLAKDLDLINADSNQIDQVLINLATNARDAMDGGGRLLIRTANLYLAEAFCRQSGECSPGPHVLLEVSDTGPGMEPEEVQRVFEPFYTSKEPGKGTGLGLATVYGIVRGHHGCVVCQSIPGQGSTFSVYLPAPGPEDISPQVMESEPAEVTGGGENLLLVDDEEALRQMCAAILGEMGYVVRTAGSGEEALDIFDLDPLWADLVVLDLGMPGMGGLDCLQALLGREPRLRVLVASGYASDEMEDKARRAGARDFLKKPFRRDDLLRSVRRVLDRGPAGEGP